MDAHRDLITLNLKTAFGEAGCPICRLRYQAEHRYMLSLLREHINDSATRQHIIPALGFCATHAWYIQRLEAHHWEDGLGVGILYEDLLKRTVAGLETYVAEQRRRAQGEPRWRRQLRTLWRRFFAGGGAHTFPAGIEAHGVCRVCAIGEENETTHLIWLIKRYREEAFRQRYARSDGLCLPHLRRALVLAEEQAPDVAIALAEDARQRGEALLVHLREYIRKHSWQHRHEAKLAVEETSWMRAVAFYAGEERKLP